MRSLVFIYMWWCTFVFINAQAPFYKNQQPKKSEKFDIQQTISSDAQINTVAFSAVAFYTGSYYASTFYPPGKVADFFGFQFMRDNDLTKSGHNTDFLTKVAWNTMNILNPEQLQKLIDLAQNQEQLFQNYAYGRFPLIKAFHRSLDQDFPKGKTELNEFEIKKALQELYKIDGEISYGRAVVFAEIINSLNTKQKDFLQKMNKSGMQDWEMPEKPNVKIPRGLNVWVMSNASELFSWYLKNFEADVYFCPERHGTYYGGFFMKDAPAVGNRGYAIDTELTANKGAYLLENILTKNQADKIRNLYPNLKIILDKIVKVRTEISIELRKSLEGKAIDKAKVTKLSEDYGALDADYNFAIVSKFLEIHKTLSEKQKKQLSELRNLANFPDKPDKVFFYSHEIDSPEITNTDHFFK